MLGWVSRRGMGLTCGHHSSNHTVFCLLNIHLNSLEDMLPFRAQQMKMLADVLRKPGCSSGIIVGDFNAVSPEDKGLGNAWVTLHGRAGPTLGAIIAG